MGIFGQIGPRWVRTSDDFEVDAKAAGARFRRFQDALSGLRQRLALDPEAGQDSGRGDGTRLARTTSLPDQGVPGLIVLYAFDADNLYLLRLRVVP